MTDENDCRAATAEQAEGVRAETPRVWVLHATDEPRLPIERNCIAIGWRELGDLSALPSDREGFAKAYRAVYRKAGGDTIAQNFRQIGDFVRGAKTGDVVVYPHAAEKTVYIGRITGEYRLVGDAVTYVNQRPVKWEARVPRHALNAAERAGCDRPVTFAEIRRGAQFYLSRIGLGASPDGGQENLQARFAERLYAVLDGFGFERFVASLFALMGFATEEVKHVGDGGIDVVAEKPLGFGYTQKVIIQCKHKRGKIPLSVCQQLRGLLEEGQIGVVATSSSLTNGAKEFVGVHGNMAVLDGEAIFALASLHRAALSGEFPGLFD